MAKKPVSTKATEELLAKLHAATAQELLTRILSGEASAAELGVTIKFLKDNNIEADLSDPEAVTNKLKQALPDFPADEKDLSGFDATIN